MGNMIDLSGQRFGRLTVLCLGQKLPNGLSTWVCKCDCGKVKEVRGALLRKGTTRSCGCLGRESVAESNRRRRVCRDGEERLHNIWALMKYRCNTESSPDYPLYGARGVTVCPEWMSSFAAFRDWALANGYRDDLTIDRRKNDGNYCPENCRWATAAEQARNRRDNVFIELDGERKTVSEWAREYGIEPSTIYRRLKCGWDAEDAVKMPPQRKGGEDE